MTATEKAETAIALILEAYKQSGLTEESFGILLMNIGKDFKSGEATKPEKVN